MINLSNKSIWLLVILVSLICIYMLYNNYNGDDYNINYLNFDRQYDKSRKRKYPKYTKSKRIYISPNFKHESIKLMKKLLQQKLNAPKKVAKMQAISKIGNKVSIPVIKKINSDKKYIIKLYFTDWCPHCSQFKPIWNKLKSRFSNNFEFIDVDCTNNSPNLPYVEGYPTISLFNMNNQHLNNYEDDRNYESIETYLNLLN